MKKIHVGILLSYDYPKLKKSLARIYDFSDRIFIAKDINNLTWSGNSFEVNVTFFDWLNEFDKDNKIEIYEDNFFIPELTPIENDTRERQLLSKKMGENNWIIQLDCDEYFVDFKGFVSTLKKYDHYLKKDSQDIQIVAYHINLYKYDNNGVFYISNPTRFEIATNNPNYVYARKTKKRKIYTPTLILHECIARDENQLKQKFDNWGHKDDVKNKFNFFEKWKSTNINTYKDKKNLFYLEPSLWKSLSYVKGNNITEIITNLDIESLKPSNFSLLKKNTGQFIKFLLRK